MTTRIDGVILRFAAPRFCGAFFMPTIFCKIYDETDENDQSKQNPHPARDRIERVDDFAKAKETQRVEYYERKHYDDRLVFLSR